MACSSIKVATKRGDEPYVHELCLAAADLEARYANREVGGLTRHWNLPAWCVMGERMGCSWVREVRRAGGQGHSTSLC